MSPLAALILKYMDGRNTVYEIIDSTLDETRGKTASKNQVLLELREIFTLLNKFDLAFLRHKNIAGFLEPEQLQNRAIEHFTAA